MYMAALLDRWVEWRAVHSSSRRASRSARRCWKRGVPSALSAGVSGGGLGASTVRPMVRERVFICGSDLLTSSMVRLKS